MQQHSRIHVIAIRNAKVFIKATIDAIKAFPILNSSVDGENIVYKQDINLGLAVALDWGLIVPVIKRAVLRYMLQCPGPRAAACELCGRYCSLGRFKYAARSAERIVTSNDRPSRRISTGTSTPASPRPSAMPFPRPLLAPVTIATRPRRLTFMAV